MAVPILPFPFLSLLSSLSLQRAILSTLPRTTRVCELDCCRGLFAIVGEENGADPLSARYGHALCRAVFLMWNWRIGHLLCEWRSLGVVGVEGWLCPVWCFSDRRGVAWRRCGEDY